MLNITFFKNILQLKLFFQTGRFQTEIETEIQIFESRRASIFAQYTTANGIATTSQTVSNPSSETAGQTGRTFGQFSPNQLTSQHQHVVDLTGGADLSTPGSFGKGSIIFTKAIITGFDYNFKFQTAVHVQVPFLIPSLLFTDADDDVVLLPASQETLARNLREIFSGTRTTRRGSQTDRYKRPLGRRTTTGAHIFCMFFV